MMKKFLLTAILLLTFSNAAEAVYESTSDTGTTIFDYIENRRREMRENVLTDEQKKLLSDIDEAKDRLPKPVEQDKPVPAAFEGDDMVYNAVTGEFIATGKVDIIQLEGYRFQSNKATGNVLTQDIEIEGKGHMLQLAEGAPRITLDGYHTVYNYRTKIGTMYAASGKAGEYFISGKRFEFYPDHVVIHDGTQTKCNAENPDYSLSAERIEIYPEQIMRMHKVKLKIKNKVVGTREYMEQRIGENNENYFPRVGYDKDDGLYIEDSFEFSLTNHFFAYLNPYLTTKNGVRSNAELHYRNREFTIRGLYGYYRDDNGKWIQKEPSLDVYFSKHFPTLPLTYSFEYEIGHWVSQTAKSRHQEFKVGLNHDPIFLPGRFLLLLGTSYTITKDHVANTENKNRQVNGMNYDIILAKEFNDRFAAFTAYHYNKSNSQNSVFDFNLDSYSQKFETGVSCKITDKDRIVVGLRFDAERGSLEDVDYFYYRDLHCSTAVFRWREKRNKFEAHWQFTPW